MKFTESRLEQAITELLGAQGYPFTPGADFARSEDEVLIEEDLRKYLFEKYQHEKNRANEVDQVILKLKTMRLLTFMRVTKPLCAWFRKGRDMGPDYLITQTEKPEISDFIVFRA